MKKGKLKIVTRKGCTGYYIRPSGGGRAKWMYLSENKAEADRMALDYERQRVNKRAEGYNAQADFLAAVDTYIKEKFATTLTTKKSQQRYEPVIRRFAADVVKRYGVKNVSDVTKDMVLAYLNARSELIKSKTWNIERAIINNFFIYCSHNDWLLKNPLIRRNH